MRENGPGGEGPVRVASFWVGRGNIYVMYEGEWEVLCTSLKVLCTKCMKCWILAQLFYWQVFTVILTPQRHLLGECRIVTQFIPSLLYHAEVNCEQRSPQPTVGRGAYRLLEEGSSSLSKKWGAY